MKASYEKSRDILPVAGVALAVVLGSTACSADYRPGICSIDEPANSSDFNQGVARNGHPAYSYSIVKGGDHRLELVYGEDITQIPISDLDEPVDVALGSLHLVVTKDGDMIHSKCVD